MSAANARSHLLHYESDAEQLHERSRNLRDLASRRVQSLGTTANPQTWQKNPDWVADLEYVWRNRTEPIRKGLGDRAKRLKREALSTVGSQDAPLCPLSEQERVRLLRASEWASERARAMSMPRVDVVGTCGLRWRTTKCKCGPREVRVGCDNPLLCESCRRRHWRKWRKKIVRSLDAHVRAARGAWHHHGRRGMLPGVYLITLTAPHSGDLGTDRDRMGRAVRALFKHATAHRWWSSYAMTWEVTNGRDARGHLHAHLAVVSSWVPYSKNQAACGGDGLHEVWRRVMPGAVVLDVQSPNGKRKRAASAADYLAKYVTKGIDPAEMTGRKAGEMLVAFRNRRKVTTSRHFWIPQDLTCKKCGCYHRMVESPCSLQDIAPGAVLRAHAVRLRWHHGEQLRLLLDPPP